MKMPSTRRIAIAAVATVFTAAAASIAGTEAIYDPPAGTFPYFPHSAFFQKIPPNPQVDERTTQWLTHTGAEIGKIQFAADPSGLAKDYTIPVYVTHASDPQLYPVSVHCNKPWGHCKAESATVRLSPNDVPEDGGNHGDAHLAIIDEENGHEYDFWSTQWPPANGTLNIGWGGICSLNNDGRDGCTGTATGTPLSLGLIRVNDLMAVLHDDHGSLPYAIATSTKWTYGHTALVNSGDGRTEGYPPEGAKAFLDMSDDEVNASGAPAIAKVLLRTIDREHYGLIVTDQNGYAPEFEFQVESDLTYTVAGKPGPLVTKLIPEAIVEGLPGSTPFRGVYYLRLPTTGIDFGTKLKFLPTGPIYK